MTPIIHYLLPGCPILLSVLTLSVEEIDSHRMRPALICKGFVPYEAINLIPGKHHHAVFSHDSMASMAGLRGVRIGWPGRWAWEK